jgi:oxygen-independent coproporphyrinogen-3 oxidase
MENITSEEAVAVRKTFRGSKFEAYIHFPYCEQRCTFCHFYKKVDIKHDYEAKEDAALNSVLAEMKMQKEVHGEKLRVKSLQLGGGTPSLISNARLIRFLDEILEYIEIEPDAEIKTEIYPKFYAEGELEEKLKILKDFGFTDIVIDLETGNKKSLDLLNRKNSSLSAYKNNITKIIEAGFDSIISALLVGVPYETYDSIVETIDYMISVPQIKVINTFPLIVRATDPINRQISKLEEPYQVNAMTRDVMCVFVRDYLRSQGYSEGPIAYFHPPTYRPAQQSDKFECVNLIGFGTSAFGYLNGDGWAGQYYNYSNQEDYTRNIADGKFPMWRIGMLNQEERARRKVIFGLANVKTENLLNVEKDYNVSIDKIYGKIFNALHKLNLIGIDKTNSGIYFTDKGLYRLEEIMYFLSSDFVKDRCDVAPDKIKDKGKYKELVNQHYFVTIPSEDRAKFEGFVASQTEEFMCRIRKVAA